MLINYEQFAVTSMMGAGDSPPRANGGLCFSEEWERTAFGVALALAREGLFEWEDFRQQLIASIDGWEKSHALDDASWSYYERWLAALEEAVIDSGLSTREEIEARVAGEGSDTSPAATSTQTGAPQ
ncbi:nitrile hydratase accessory protein [Hansschlegelia zhihuaiae]|uniref:Nitrile hydratase accessory protein n=1 Tax=Hansschlegelia zhihuaiae TaxID=405005 RepID=A0A4Q0ML08_9HYPH|nr:nitrile hydratase accessory protein [Hansschlegelia zhihuaiae]RXF73726.1 nitrile hydratase accessory protein [Hansschlegelia zhihuaiae]